MAPKKRRVFYALLGIWLYCAGCVETVGTIVPADNRIPLVKGGTQTGNFKAFEFVMSYTYRFSQESTQLSGQLKIDGSIALNAGALDSLSIWIHLLDGSGKVLSSESLYMTGYKSSGVSRDFSVDLKTPPEAAGMSFTYAAQMKKGHR